MKPLRQARRGGNVNLISGSQKKFPVPFACDPPNLAETHREKAFDVCRAPPRRATLRRAQVVRVRRQAVLALAKLGFAAAEDHAGKVAELMRADKESASVRLACVPGKRAARAPFRT